MTQYRALRAIVIDPAEGSKAKAKRIEIGGVFEASDGDQTVQNLMALGAIQQDFTEPIDTDLHVTAVDDTPANTVTTVEEGDGVTPVQAPTVEG